MSERDAFLGGEGVGSTQSSFYWDDLVEKRATSRGESQNDTSRTDMSSTFRP